MLKQVPPQAALGVLGGYVKALEAMGIEMSETIVGEFRSKKKFASFGWRHKDNQRGLQRREEARENLQAH
jgi:hypothetical protein